MLDTRDPVQDGEHSVTLRRVSGALLIQAGDHVPVGPTTDSAAIELPTGIHGDTPSCRPCERVTLTQLAPDVGAYSFALTEPGAIFAEGEVSPGQPVDKPQKFSAVYAGACKP